MDVSRVAGTIAVGLLGGSLLTGCVLPAAPHPAMGPQKPIGLTSFTPSWDATNAMACKAKNCICAPVPEPGGFSSTQFRYNMQQARLRSTAAAAGRDGVRPKPPVPPAESQQGPAESQGVAQRSS